MYVVKRYTMWDTATQIHNYIVIFMFSFSQILLPTENEEKRR